MEQRSRSLGIARGRNVCALRREAGLQGSNQERCLALSADTEQATREEEWDLIARGERLEIDRPMPMTHARRHDFCF